MTTQKLDKLSPALDVDIANKTGNPEPNASGDDVDKLLRLRRLLWSGPWQDRDVQLVAWDDKNGRWVMWEHSSG